MNEPIADQKVSCTVIQKAPRMSYLGSDRKLKFTLTPHRCEDGPRSR